MNFLQTEPCQHIDIWLRIATKDLCSSAKERITLEIETHYQEAVAAHLVEGTTLVKAQAKALEELGDAKKAARRFRRKHLTAYEERKLRRTRVFTRKRPALLQKICGILALLGSMGYLFDHPRDLVPFDFLNLFTGILICMPWFFYRLVRTLPRKRALQRSWQLQPFVYAVVSVETGISLYMALHSLLVATSASCIFLIIILIRWLRLWQKLETAHLA